ncbi:hypothetical protein Pmar_PMAR010456 [Perkinsus marinus ATCC 50983]|uniref:C3H1-type domain-containing protein n=1 Tax=Perkinsus marinus (strain ATCC 50983 / TXsc) TaxID=423536 RepID=C5LEC2_PERM5|nr:hypothetical protein Pmar_PMAR010456 [Perkinsus marinus ATCC 50983]EER04904.1 hypothetical protein Pmar_PMAR010456 [Perkinsus marinus ATCC 50983]|eukprot:XP_002773088.1 hypothetical protein Pmar_PMAR010456 [Perkinsus marinus ATCC 50983]
MRTAANRYIDDEVIAAKFRESLRDDLRKKIEVYLGPRYVDLEETREAAECFESKIQGRSAAGSTFKTDVPKKTLCRAFAAGKSCRFSSKCRFNNDRNVASTLSRGSNPESSTLPTAAANTPSKSKRVDATPNAPKV